MQDYYYLKGVRTMAKGCVFVISMIRKVGGVSCLQTFELFKFFAHRSNAYLIVEFVCCIAVFVPNKFSNYRGIHIVSGARTRYKGFSESSGRVFFF